MSRPASRSTVTRLLFVASLVLLVVLVDVITKEWVRTYPPSSVIQQFGFFRIIHTENTGASFGMFQGQVAVFRVTAAVGAAILVALGIWLYRRHPAMVSLWTMVAYSFILGGVTGNLIDRVRFGPVTDFIDLRFWPAFNVADSGISVGTVMVALWLLREMLKGGK